jgi:hypothetical protein
LDLILSSIHVGAIHEKAKQLLEKAGKGWGFLEIQQRRPTNQLSRRLDNSGFT